MSDEANTEMRVADSQLTTEIESIIDEGDLESLTRKQVLKKLEDLFNLDLTDRKKFIYAEVQRLVQKKVDEEDDEEEEKDYASEEEEEEAPAPKRQKTRGGGRQNKKKKPKGNRRPNAKPSGIMQPRKLSKMMAAFMGRPEAARTEVAKRISAYVKENELQDEADRRKIHLDDTLFDMFQVKEMTYFNMQKYISPHIESGSKRKKSSGGGVSGLKKPQILSEELSAVLGTKMSSRSQVVKNLWIYIKANDLQNPEDKREILCDEKLRAVFNEDKVHMFTMNKVLSKHLTAAPEGTPVPGQDPPKVNGTAKEDGGDAGAESTTATAEAGDSAPSSSSSSSAALASDDAEEPKAGSTESSDETQTNGTAEGDGNESPAALGAPSAEAEDTAMADADASTEEAPAAEDDAAAAPSTNGDNADGADDA